MNIDMFDRLNCFFKLLNKRRDESSMTMAGFQIITVKHSIQIDNYNCGSFILHFIYCILNGFDLDTSFDPDKYRLHIQESLLSKSQNMKNACLSCGAIIKEPEKCFKCKACSRLVQNECLGKDQELNFDFNNGMCPPCQLYGI
ncbi:hypothetical protein JTB14_037424 [Gonioctena quinquepunctata]|nr:hypothetical protein JTB14_037424 [Gonioctena quinquepunctata]